MGAPTGFVQLVLLFLGSFSSAPWPARGARPEVSVLIQGQPDPSFVPAGSQRAASKSSPKIPKRPPVVNFKPLIGILSQPGDGDGGLAPRLARFGPQAHRRLRSRGQNPETLTKEEWAKRRSRSDKDESYIAASYVKWVEMAGARPVPFLYDEPKAELTRKFNMVNGLIFPGGGTPLIPGPFFSAVEHLFTLALEANRRGDYFPIQATCLGMEALTIFISQNFSILQEKKFASDDNPARLHFTSENAKTESLFSWMSPLLLKHVQTRPLTMENHGDGTTVDRFLSSAKLTDFFDILTTSVDKNGTEYVSTIAGKQFPFYGTQWHPEKSCFEWGLDHIPHSAEGVAVCQAAANFLVNEARRNTHAPASEDEMDDVLIYNYNPVFSGKHGDGFFEQSYVFKKENVTSMD